MPYVGIVKVGGRQRGTRRVARGAYGGGEACRTACGRSGVRCTRQCNGRLRTAPRARSQTQHAIVNTLP